MKINSSTFYNVLRILSLLSIAFLFSLTLILEGSASEIVLSPSGGVNDDIQINNAIQSYDTVILSPGTFYISNSIYTKDSTILQGSGMDSTTLQAVNPSTWYFKGSGLIYLNAKDNVEISHMKIHGGEVQATYREHTGHDWQNAIVVSGGSDNCKIHDIYFTMVCNDAVRVSSSTSGGEVYNCKMLPTGHDGVQLWGGSGWHIYNNIINLNINCGFRFANSENCECDHNTIYCDTGSGYVGVELESSGDYGYVNDIWIHDNLFLHSNNPYNTGIGTVHAQGSGIIIEYNVFEDTNPLSMEGVTYTFENNAYSRADIPNAGYSETYEDTFFEDIQNYFRGDIPDGGITPSSQAETALPLPEDPNELNESQTTPSSSLAGQDTITKINIVIDAFKQFFGYIGEMATILITMALVYFFLSIFYRILGSVL